MADETLREDDPDELSGSPIDDALRQINALDARTPAMPERIGRYRILGIIGEGGMGVVYEAEQEDTSRRVALKVIRPGMVTRALMRRFRHEALVLGQLRHPGIAQIYEADTTDHGEGGQPFFAMELVVGEPLLAHTHANKLGVDERLALFARVCDALNHAHQKAVIHRDLKPDNILVECDGGRPKILDFGVARATDADLQTVSEQTSFGQLVGTVPYMSPEQAAGDPAELDIRSDIYALGVILFELLADRLPYPVKGKLIHEAVRVIRHDEPSRLSAVNRSFRGDVETIVAKALEKEAGRRYQSASELAEDIRRFLRDEPIVARPPTLGYQLRKFARRNRVLVSLLTLSLFILVLGVVGTGVGFVQASRARDIALERKAEIRGILKRNAQLLLESGDASGVRTLLSSYEKDERDWVWYWLESRVDSSAFTLEFGDARDLSVFVTPRGVLLARHRRDGGVEVIDWNAPSVPLLEILANSAPITAIAASDDGKRVATGDNAARIAVHDLDAGSVLAEITLGGSRVQQVAFANDGASVVTLQRGASARQSVIGVWRWKQEESEPRTITIDEPDVRMAVDSSGQRLATVDLSRMVRIIELEDGQVTESIKVAGPPRSVAWRPGSTEVVVGGIDRAIRRWNSTLEERPTPIGFSTEQTVTALAVSPDGSIIATGDSIGDIRLCTMDGTAIGPPRFGHLDTVTQLQFTPNGRWLISKSRDGTFRFWSIATSTPEWIDVPGIAFPTSCVIDGGTDRVILGDHEGVVSAFEPSLGQTTAPLLELGASTTALDVTADGSLVAAATANEAPSVLRPGTTRPVTLDVAVVERPDGDLRAAALSPDGRFVAAGWSDGALRVWVVETGERVFAIDTGPDWIDSIRFAPDSAVIFTATTTGVHRWDARNGRALGRLPTAPNAQKPTIDCLDISPDGSRVIAGGEDGDIRFWTSPFRDPPVLLRGHAGGVLSVLFSTDGSTIVTAGSDGYVRLRDGHRGDLILTLTLGGTFRIAHANFGPDGTSVLAAIMDSPRGELARWRVREPMSIAEIIRGLLMPLPE